MTAFEFYQAVTSMRLYFQGKYDAPKYNFKTNAKIENVDRRFGVQQMMLLGLVERHKVNPLTYAYACRGEARPFDSGPGTRKSNLSYCANLESILRRGRQVATAIDYKDPVICALDAASQPALMESISAKLRASKDLDFFWAQVWEDFNRHLAVLLKIKENLQ